MSKGMCLSLDEQEGGVVKAPPIFVCLRVGNGSYSSNSSVF